MQLTPFVILWCGLAAVVLVLALMRYLTSLHEDDNLHLGPDGRSLIANQKLFFRYQDAIDRWGKMLTIVVLVGGLILAGIYLYRTIPG